MMFTIIRHLPVIRKSSNPYCTFALTCESTAPPAQCFRRQAEPARVARGLTGGFHRPMSLTGATTAALEDKVPSDEYGVLMGHVFTNLINNLFCFQFVHAICATAFIHDGFILAKNFARFRCKFHPFSPCPAGFPAGL